MTGAIGQGAPQRASRGNQPRGRLHVHVRLLPMSARSHARRAPATGKPAAHSRPEVKP